MIEVGIGLLLLCALLTNVAFLCEHRGAVAAPPVSAVRPWASIKGLFASRWWTIGWAIGFVAWVLHVAALAVAPLSLVQAVIAGGLALIAGPAQRWFGIELGRREWLGLMLSAAGLAFLIATAAAEQRASSSYSTSAMLGFELVALAVGVTLLVSGREGGHAARCGAMMGIAAGLLIGVSDVSIKALTDSVPGDPLAVLSPWSAIALIASLCALYALARALQIGGAIQVIALSSIAANLAAISGGVLVFGDSIGSDPLSITARVAAFATVIAAAGLIQGRQAGVSAPSAATA